jgi:tRNA (cmo5U34)-methyltransferase
MLTLPDNAGLPIAVLCEDICQTPISQASVVVLNFTLQFIDPARRRALIQKIADGMQPGGILILSEKIRFPAEDLNELFIDLYHQFKQVQGYSALEVAQKRAALENVLIPETIDAHMARLSDAGFRSCDVWFQCFNFMSMVAVR